MANTTKTRLTADQRREIVEALQNLLTKSPKNPGLWLYPDGWSDQKIASEKGTTPATVIGIRTSLFGALDSIGYIPVGQMAKRIVALEEQLASLTATVNAMRSPTRVVVGTTQAQPVAINGSIPMR